MDLLTNQVHQLEEQMALTDAQCHAQSQDTKAMKESLAEASMELEVHVHNYVIIIIIIIQYSAV